MVSTPPTGLDVTVYPVIGAPPVLAGAANDTVACAFPAMAVTPVGAPGAVANTTLCDAVDVALYCVLPGWKAVMVQVPAVSMVTVVLETPQTALVEVP